MNPQLPIFPFQDYPGMEEYDDYPDHWPEVIELPNSLDEDDLPWYDYLPPAA